MAESLRKVYAVLHWIDHDDCTVESVWTTRELAVERGQVLGRRNITICECPLDPIPASEPCPRVWSEQEFQRAMIYGVCRDCCEPRSPVEVTYPDGHLRVALTCPNGHSSSLYQALPKIERDTPI